MFSPIRSLTLALALLGACAAASAFDITDLMRAMAAHPQRHGQFVETRYLAMLKEPLLSQGQVRYIAPQFFEKKTTSPVEEILRVDGDTLLVQRAGKTWRLRLSAQPQAAAFVDVVAGLLTADARLLERSYHYTLTGKPQMWTLKLQPKTPQMQAIITEIIASGDAQQLRSIEYRQADGDRSVMRIEPLD